MPSLGRFQERFVRGLTSATPMPGRFSDPAFAVYRNTWRKALADALADAYPVVARLIGPEAFQALALQFVGERAAPSPVLAEFGAGFADFIAAHPIDADLPYLADVARLERMTTEAHIAPDAEPLDPRRLAGRVTAHESIALHPAARFAWFETPAVTIWEAHQAAGPLEALAPKWVGEGALVARPDGRVAVTPVSVDAYRLLCELRAGRPPASSVETEAMVERLAGRGAFVERAQRED